MFNNISKSRKNEIEKLFNEIQINLENNYKDLAIGARKEAEEKLDLYKEEGELKEKDYLKLKKRLDEYTTKMKGYHH